MYLVNKEKINQSLSTKIVDARIAQVFNSFRNVLVTSSFGTTSAVLLHLLSRIRPDCPVYFINTGYHFDETISYKDKLTNLLGLKVIELRPDPAGHVMTQQNSLWEKNADRCCEINKVEPMEQVKGDYDVWMSGLIGFQNKYRSTLNIMDQKDEMLKFYPLIDWHGSLVKEYMVNHSLPQHPLKEKGYHSVGCTHCTAMGIGREGRWNSQSKTECGLHQ